MQMGSNINIKSASDIRRQNIYRRLMMIAPSISCPQGRKVQQLCINPECQRSMRCGQPKCNSCGSKVHDSCFSMPLEQVTKLFNLKVEKWTDTLTQIFAKEDELIIKIKEGQQQFIGRFFEQQMTEAGLNIVKKFHKTRDYEALSGEKALEMMKELQRRLKVNQDEANQRRDAYLAELMAQGKQISSLRQINFLRSKQQQVIKPESADRKDANSKQLNEPILSRVKQIMQKRSLENSRVLLDPVNSPVRTAEEYYNEGVDHNEVQQYEQAVMSFRKVIEVDPNYPSIYYDLGVALQNSGKAEEAVEAYRKAIQINRNDVEVHFTLGCTLDSLGRSEQAISSYQRALKIDPTHALAHSNLGVALDNIGRTKQAIVSYRTALEIDPTNALGFNNLGFALYATGKYEEAIMSYHKAIEVDPYVDHVYQNIEVLVSKSQWRTVDNLNGSIEFLENIVNSNPGNQRAAETLDVLRTELEEIRYIQRHSSSSPQSQ